MILPGQGRFAGSAPEGNEQVRTFAVALKTQPPVMVQVAGPIFPRRLA
jgi:hypothetical protein